LPLSLELNRALDVRGFASAYATHGVVRIPNVLSPASAEAVARVLEQMPWQLGLSESDDPKGVCYDEARIKALGQSAVNARVAAVLQRARSGFAYLYLVYPMIESYITGKDPGHPIHEISEFLNAPDFLRLLRDVTGRPDILKADAAATFYRPGDFLTYHDDGSQNPDTVNRACAYTFGFTRFWRPDWGGQLLFHDAAGHISQGLAPGFNSLTLFTVPRPHSVAQVAAYASARRLSIVGWGRTDPGPKSRQ
jgi:SM-20-related protein